MEKELIAAIGLLIGLISLLIRAWIKERQDKPDYDKERQERNFAVSHKLVSQVNALKIRVANLERDSARMFSKVDQLRDDSGKINVSYATINLTLNNIQKALDSLQAQFEGIEK